MNRWLMILALLSLSCTDDTTSEVEKSGTFDWDEVLPGHFPKPKIPADNPMTYEKVELGRHLFYDTRLSGNQTQSCASCHVQENAFSDPRARAVGSTGEVHPRGSMSLANVVYASVLTWGNPLMVELEDQMLVPLFGEDPVELGLGAQEEVLGRLSEDPVYVDLFERAFPGEGITLVTMTKAIGSFQRSLISAGAPYDRYQAGESDALSESEKRGMDLFFSERLECFHCHGGFSLADAVTHEGLVFDEPSFHNNGLYNVDGFGAYPPENGGVFEITGILEDSGRFKAPTLRNIAVTAPYMHDGSLETLDDVIDHYARGGTLTEDGPNAGDGAQNRFKSEFVNGFELSESEREDLLNFLRALTDEEFLNNPAHSDPW